MFTKKNYIKQNEQFIDQKTVEFLTDLFNQTNASIAYSITQLKNILNTIEDD